MSRSTAARVGCRLLLLVSAGCALPVVTAGTFLPAGDLQKGDLHASVSFEASRVLAGPSDVRDRPSTPPEAQRWEVATWFGSDASLRWQALRALSLEVQLKLTNPIIPFQPNLVGGALGARLRLRERSGPEGFAVELAARAVGVSVQERLDRSANGRSQTDIWNYRAGGLEVPLVVSWRIHPLFAATAAPFARLYYIRAWHNVEQSSLVVSQAALQWSPVLSVGMGLSGALTLGPIEIAPGLAVELATRPGPNEPTHFLFEPGLSLGTRF